MDAPVDASVDAWVLVCAGLVAHADGRLEVEEWDVVTELLEAAVAEDLSSYLDLLSDPEGLERRFEAMRPPDEMAAREVIAYRAWQVALGDGAVTEVEASVHQRICARLGIDEPTAENWRKTWSELAATRGEIAVGLAAVLAHLDGSLDPAEAVSFTEILDRVPVPVARRLELGELLHAPPPLDELVARASPLPEREKVALVRTVLPMVRASARGDREQATLATFAEHIGLPPDLAREA